MQAASDDFELYDDRIHQSHKMTLRRSQSQKVDSFAARPRSTAAEVEAEIVVSVCGPIKTFGSRSGIDVTPGRVWGRGVTAWRSSVCRSMGLQKESADQYSQPARQLRCGPAECKIVI